MTRIISVSKVKVIHEYFLKGTLSKRELAMRLKISRNTLKKHLLKMKLYYDKFPDEISSIKRYVTFVQTNKKTSERYLVLVKKFSAVFNSIINSNSNLISEWKIYREKNPDGYGHTQFQLNFSRWSLQISLPLV
jgi:hypothetical protein